MLKVSEALQEGTDTLRKASVDSPRIDAGILLAHILKIPRAKLLAEREAKLKPSILEKYKRMINKRAKRIPIQYLTGAVEFFSLQFEVNKNVLIPRPETELLVEKAIEVIKDDMQIADMGTGSGCIAISISRNCNVNVCAIDKSASALKVARRNTIKNNVANKIEFLKGDTFEPIGKLKGELDIIVSNPPYIAKSEYQNLQPEVKYEPKIALLIGKKGIEFHCKLIENAPIYLKPGGWLIFEVGIGQANEIKKLIKQGNKYGDVEIYKDLAGIDRVIKAQTNG